MRRGAPPPRAPSAALALVCLVVSVGLAAGGCEGEAHEPVPDAGARMEQRSLQEVLVAETPRLLGLPGVVGTAEGETEDGAPCILVLVVDDGPELRARVPAILGGHPVRIRATGELEAR